MIDCTWPRRRLGLGCLLLFVLVAAVYLQIAKHDFISFDDNLYIYDNPYLTNGFNPGSLRWAISTFYQFNWHPLTWLSHMLDVSLFGFNPAGHHLHSALLHGCNASLLFLFLAVATGAPGKSLVVAALFAVHPLRVESVAWAAERKDVLSGFFGLASLNWYALYARSRRRSEFLISLSFFAASLLSKPLLVTLPIVLLLVDWWPLCRWERSYRSLKGLFLEKIPFFILATASAVVTLVAQYQGGAVASVQAIPPGVRLENAVLSYWRYVGKTVFPTGLSFFYPFPHDFSTSAVLVAGFATLLLSLVLFVNRHKVPAAAFGWSWFLITLLPMIGLIQVGNQSMADRYSYITTIGLLIAFTWSGEKICRIVQVKQRTAVGLATVIVVAYGLASWRQTSYWRNSYSLFGHALQLNPDNYMALTQMGDLLRLDNRCNDSIPYYNRSLQLVPSQENVYNNTGICLIQLGQLDEAVRYLGSSVEMNPRSVEGHFNMGVALAMLGQHQAAAASFSRVLALEPTDAGAIYNLAKSLAALGRNAEAAGYFKEAARLDPSFARWPAGGGQ